MQITFDTSQVDRNLKKILKAFPEATKQAMSNAVAVVEEEAKENCPVDTGTLRSSIKGEVKQEGKKINGYVYTNEEYAIDVHFGTGIYASDGQGRQTPWYFKDRKDKWHFFIGQEPKPFLQDAINSKQREVLQELGKVLDYV